MSKIKTATQKQVKVLKNLRYDGDPAVLTIGEASFIIEQLMQQASGIDPHEIETVKANVKIEDLVTASGLTVVQRAGKFTTQEHDSLILYPQTNSFAWYSQSGKGGKNLGGGVYEWYMHQENCSFAEAHEALAAKIGTLPAATPKPAATAGHRQPKVTTTNYRQQAVAAMRRLDVPEGDAVLEYLDKRSIDYVTAHAWGLGAYKWYDQWTVSMPHSRDGQITIKLRLISPVDPGDKCRWLGNAVSLFGEHMLPGVAQDRRTLFAVEGELNAVSIWVAASRYIAGKKGKGANFYLPVDVLSFGNKAVPHHLKERLIEVAAPYRQVFVWADESEDTQAIVKALPNAIGIKTAYKDGAKMDANELLQRGLLAGFIAMKLEKHASDDQERESLYWCMREQVATVQGISSGEAQVMRNLAQRLEKPFPLVQVERDR